MQLQELQRVREQERETDSLQHLRDQFYLEVATYLENLREERDARAAAADDPFADPDVRDVADELKTATRIVESLYERRVGKIVKLASFEAADMQTETDGLTAEERVLFDSIVENIRENREDVLALIRDETTQLDSTTQVSDPTPAEFERGEPPDERAEPSESVESTENEPADDDDIQRTRVRIREDIGEIVGVDAQPYALAVDDVIDLPVENAQPLLERGVADELE